MTTCCDRQPYLLPKYTLGFHREINTTRRKQTSALLRLACVTTGAWLDPGSASVQWEALDASCAACGSLGRIGVVALFRSRSRAGVDLHARFSYKYRLSRRRRAEGCIGTNNRPFHTSQHCVTLEIVGCRPRCSVVPTNLVKHVNQKNGVLAPASSSGTRQTLSHHSKDT